MLRFFWLEPMRPALSPEECIDVAESSFPTLTTQFGVQCRHQDEYVSAENFIVNIQNHLSVLI